METGQAPKCANDAQSLHALVSVLSPSVLDNGAVLLLPKHRCCCAGSCHGVEPRNYKEIRENKEIREDIEIRENKEVQETQENRHSLEGVWERAPGTGLRSLFFVIHTVQAKPGYLFGTALTGEMARKVLFWFRSDGKAKDVLEGKWFAVGCEYL